MNFILLPSLQHLALAKIAVALWSEDDVKNIMILYHDDVNPSVTEDKVILKSQKLSIPERLKKELLCFINGVRWQIQKRLQYFPLSHFHITSERMLSHLSFTSLGTIDVEKTIKNILNDGDLEIFERYGLACTFCFEDDVMKCWEKMSEHCKTYILKEYKPDNLVVVWTCTIKWEMSRVTRMIENWPYSSCSSANQFAFEYAAMDSNLLATKYFFQKLTPEEKEASLLRAAKYLKNDKSDVLFYLLTQMSMEQQQKLFRHDPSGVSNCLLSWPRQSLFLQAANDMMKFFKEVNNFEFLLFTLTLKIAHGEKDYDYQSLVWEFLRQIPDDYKHVFYRCIFDDQISPLLHILFPIGDIKDIKMILEYATPNDKEYILSGFGFVAKSLMDSGKWDVLNYLCEELMLSKDNVIKFKEKFVRSFCASEDFSPREMKLFELLDNLIREFDTRCDMNEMDCGPSQR